MVVMGKASLYLRLKSTETFSCMLLVFTSYTVIRFQLSGIIPYLFWTFHLMMTPLTRCLKFEQDLYRNNS